MKKQTFLHYLIATLSNKCPRCRKGPLFKNPNPYKLKECIDMHKNCPVCGQETEIEVGFYYGTGYVSYAIAVGFVLCFFGVWYLSIGFSIDDNRLFWCLGSAIVLLILLQPIIMRMSRSLWLSWFVSYDANWKNNNEANKK